MASRPKANSIGKRTTARSPFCVTRTARASNREADAKERATESRSVHLRRRKMKRPSVEEIQGAIEVLRQFDMTLRFGPCVGMSRRRRWERAVRFSLNPPETVIGILDDQDLQEAIPNIDRDLWHVELH